MTDNKNLYVGSVFQVSLRNVNLKGRSTKGGMIYRFEAEITEDDFDLFRGHDLTGSCFEAMVECTAMPDNSGSSNGRTSTFEVEKAGSSPAPETKPWGREASTLYANGFFLVPAVLEAIGTDSEFLDWIRRQPCAVTGERDYHKDEATGTVTERCEAAHVRRIANGAGTAEKPPFSALPLIHQWHDAQTKIGESVFSSDGGQSAEAGRAWMDRQRTKYVVAWASQKLADELGYKSMGFVPPVELLQWAAQHNLIHWLPAAYK